ncbi:pyridoxamine 5'-phosphate oxidase family protein [Devosia sp. SD17-2]|jgi:general stress protein 26|uniref:pyridoxamine 5'-phosphate oxidase family protein n=1 Tax=Devosia sp. SD17-2 TaxID=2976459 RepID=UPI0023D89C17|nr:pyridoxamine 5'-phosphate oxidase family protein [Devosia sp. SD17-2]WEJ34444.1 pyridoxamine 5'-phosphate oxidase family protein [Devosia sp. SD17-2]
MAVDNNTTLPRDEAIDRIWELADDIDFCMFTTWNGEQQASRPMSARVERDENAIYFLTSADTGKVDELAKFPNVSLGFADNANHSYVVIAGKAVVTNDRAKIKDLWNAFDKAFWDDENDPQIRLITVTPEDAELWDGPNGLIAGAKMLFAVATGAKPDMGDNSKVSL